MCRLVSNMRAQSPNNVHQYHYSPTRHHSNLSSDERKTEDKKVDQSKAQTTVRKNTNVNSTNPVSQTEKNVVTTDPNKTRSSCDKRLKGDTPEKTQSPDRKTNMFPKVDSSEKKMQSNVQDGDKNKGGMMKYLLVILSHSVLIHLDGFDISLSVFDRIDTMHGCRKSGSWHNKCRGGYQVAGRT